MEVQKVDIAGLQLLQRSGYREVERLLMVAGEVDCVSLAQVVATVGGGESDEPVSNHSQPPSARIRCDIDMGAYLVATTNMSRFFLSAIHSPTHFSDCSSW
jgi:hypothetical protein